MSLCDRLKAIRLHLGLSQQEFASKFNISQSTYGSYERGDRSIPDELKLSLTRFAVNMNWFFTGQGDMFFDSAKNWPNRNEASNQSKSTGQGSRFFDSAKNWPNRNEASKDRAEELLDTVNWIKDMMEARGMLDDEGRAIRVSCPLCHVVNKLDKKRQTKALGYAEALYHEMHPEEPATGDLSWQNEAREDAPEYGTYDVALPFASGIAAGEPREVFFDYEVYRVDRRKLKGPVENYVAVRVTGTSMTHADIPDNSVVIIRKGQPLISGKIYLVRHEGAYTLKRYIKEKDGTQRLVYDDGTGRSVVVEDGDYKMVGQFCFVAE